MIVEDQHGFKTEPSSKESQEPVRNLRDRIRETRDDLIFNDELDDLPPQILAHVFDAIDHLAIAGRCLDRYHWARMEKND